MAIRKSELYSSIWASYNELRGGMYAWQYKDFVFGKIQNMPIEGKAHFYFALPFLRII
jgi:type I restriction-modification system DNA methylase subunit